MKRDVIQKQGFPNTGRKLFLIKKKKRNSGVLINMFGNFLRDFFM